MTKNQIVAWYVNPFDLALIPIFGLTDLERYPKPYEDSNGVYFVSTYTDYKTGELTDSYWKWISARKRYTFKTMEEALEYQNQLLSSIELEIPKTAPPADISKIEKPKKAKGPARKNKKAPKIEEKIEEGKTAITEET